MPLCQCPDCKQVISSSLKRCFHCGADTEKGPNVILPVVAACVAMSTVAALSGAFFKARDEAAGRPTAVLIAMRPQMADAAEFAPARAARKGDARAMQAAPWRAPEAPSARVAEAGEINPDEPARISFATRLREKGRRF